MLQLRHLERRGQDWIGPELGLPARTVSAILRRHRVPYLRECDPLTVEVIRASKTTTVRYEHDHPGSLVTMDVKKVGRIPDGGGWRAHGRSEEVRGRGIGYDYVHSLVDDHSRLAYSEILPDEKGTTCAAFLLRAAAHFAGHGIPRIERVMIDNHLSYRRSRDLAAALAGLDPRHVFIRPHCPGRTARGRALQPHPAGRVGLPTGLPQQRRAHRSAGALAGVLQHSTTQLSHRRTTPDQPTVMNVPAEYSSGRRAVGPQRSLEHGIARGRDGDHVARSSRGVAA